MTYTITLDNYKEIFTEEVLNVVINYVNESYCCFGEEVVSEGDNNNVILNEEYIANEPTLAMALLTRLWLRYISEKGLINRSDIVDDTEYMSAFTAAYFECIAEWYTCTMKDETYEIFDILTGGFYSNTTEYDLYEGWADITVYYDYNGTIWEINFTDYTEGIDYDSVTIHNTGNTTFDKSFHYEVKTKTPTFESI